MHARSKSFSKLKTLGFGCGPLFDSLRLGRAVRRSVARMSQVSSLAFLLFLANATATTVAQEREITTQDLGPSSVASEAPISPSSDTSASANVLDDAGYKITPSGESEFDNQSEGFVKDWRDADPDYDDTEFGELIYNEASTPTKLEMLRLLSKDTPSILVFMHAIAMGLDIEDVLQAAVKYEPSKGRDLAASAVTILPLMTDSNSYLYSSYGLDDLEREDESKPYSIAEVSRRFFEEREVLRPYPDWFDGQYHFLASAAELKSLQAPQKNIRWYRSKSTQSVTNRPVFVSLYENNQLVLIDSETRINEALAANPEALLPVVFVFNRLNERPIDQLGYPHTIRGLQDAYAEQTLMVTPTPEWQLGEYHIQGAMDEVYEIFEIPEQDDYEPEAWAKLLREAEDYSVSNTSFLFVVIASGEDDVESAKLAITPDQVLAAWDNPRTEGEFSYTTPQNGEPVNLENIMGKGLIFNRPDLISALSALGVQRVPISFYYIDSARMRPYTKGPRALIQAAIGAGTPPGSFGGGGFTPPPPASPAGLQQ